MMKRIDGAQDIDRFAANFGADAVTRENSNFETHTDGLFQLISRSKHKVPSLLHYAEKSGDDELFALRTIYMTAAWRWAAGSSDNRS